MISVSTARYSGVERGVELVFGRDMRLGRLGNWLVQNDDYVPRNIETRCRQVRP